MRLIRLLLMRYRLRGRGDVSKGADAEKNASHSEEFFRDPLLKRQGFFVRAEAGNSLLPRCAGRWKSSQSTHA